MTTKEFYNLAVQAAKERGFENPKPVVITMMSESDRCCNFCKLWIPDKRKYIEGKIQNNPSAAIESFKDSLDYEMKVYETTSEGLSLEDTTEVDVKFKSIITKEDIVVLAGTEIPGLSPSNSKIGYTLYVQKKTEIFEEITGRFMKCGIKGLDENGNTHVQFYDYAIVKYLFAKAIEHRANFEFKD